MQAPQSSVQPTHPTMPTKKSSNPLYTIIERTGHWCKGRMVYHYECNICHTVRKNDNNAMRHCLHCLQAHEAGHGQMTIEKCLKMPNPSRRVQVTPTKQPDPDQPPARLQFKLARLVQLFASQNIAYTSIEDPNWRNFIEAVAPDFEVPSSSQFRAAIIQYSLVITHQGLSDLRG